MTSTISTTPSADAASAPDPALTPENVGAVEELRQALAATETLVAGVGSGQWDEPTGCPDWTVRELLNHLVTGNLSFAALLTEQPPPDRAADHLGTDPERAYRQAANELIAAFVRPGVLDRVYQAPPGAMPGLALARLRITEALVHGWDLARATDQSSAALPAALAETELGLVTAQLAGVPRTGHPFGPAQPVAEDAPAIDRLVAYLGRPVRSQPAPEPSTYYVVQFHTSYRSLEEAMGSDPELIAAHVAHSNQMRDRGELLMAARSSRNPARTCRPWPLRRLGKLPTRSSRGIRSWPPGRSSSSVFGAGRTSSLRIRGEVVLVRARSSRRDGSAGSGPRPPSNCTEGLLCVIMWRRLPVEQRPPTW